MIIPEKDDYSILSMVFMLFLLSLVGKTEFENFWLTSQTHREGWVEGGRVGMLSQADAALLVKCYLSL